jgi:hypothetical protein
MALPNVTLPVFTQDIVRTYTQLPSPTQWMRNFFADDYTPAKYPMWAVKRVAATKANDILLNQTGNMNKNSLALTKTIEPKLYDERLDLMDNDLFWRMFNSNDISMSQMADVKAKLKEDMLILRNKIERAKEYDRIQCLLTGTTTYDATGQVVDFGRRAGSFFSGAYWSVSTTNPFVQIGEMVDFIRTVGYAGVEGGYMDNVYICLMGSEALAAFQANTIFLQMNRDMYGKLNDIQMPELEKMGGVSHGVYSVGSYKVVIYTYPAFYVPNIAAPETTTPFMDPKQIMVMPFGKNFATINCGVPTLPAGLFPATSGIVIPGGLTEAKDYYYYSYPDISGRAWISGVMSRPFSVPIKIDQIATRQVVA